jgi:hypothetical protein
MENSKMKKKGPYEVEGPMGPKNPSMPKPHMQDHNTKSSMNATSGYDNEPKADPSKEAKMAPQHEAKKNVLKHLSDSMKRHMGESIKDHLSAPKKVVSVEAPDAAGLKKGLDIASQLAPHMDEMSKAASGIMDEDESEEPRDIDEAAMDHEEEENEMPQDHASLMAEHQDQDHESSQQLEELKKHLAKKA